ncbi:MAG: RNA 2',3'-cyclic phosphodiesterase [Candidatus Nanohaloarchaea archaeon]
MVRAFTAVEISDRDLLEELSRVRDRLDLGFSPVEAGKMHMTLEFFSDIDQEELEKVKESMDQVSIGGFNGEVRGVGCFPNRDYIRVVWAGVESEKIYDLERKVSDNGVVSDNDHDFHPHVTLMRVKNISQKQKNKLQRSLREFEDHYIGEIEIKRLKLFKSEFKGGESVYTELHSSRI